MRETANKVLKCYTCCDCGQRFDADVGEQTVRCFVCARSAELMAKAYPLAAVRVRLDGRTPRPQAEQPNAG